MLFNLKGVGGTYRVGNVVKETGTCIPRNKMAVSSLIILLDLATEVRR